MLYTDDLILTFFTFNLETETVSTLIFFFSSKRVSDLYLSALRGRDDVFRMYFRYDFE